MKIISTLLVCAIGAIAVPVPNAEPVGLQGKVLPRAIETDLATDGTLKRILLARSDAETDGTLKRILLARSEDTNSEVDGTLKRILLARSEDTNAEADGTLKRILL